MKIIFMSLIALTCAAGSIRADIATLKNGDRVTGTLVIVKDGKLQLKSDVLGNLEIPISQVATFAAAKPVAVVVKGGKPVQGQLEISASGDWQVTADGKSQTIPAASVDMIMPTETYHALVEHSAKPWQDWTGSASLGYSVQSGDQNTSSFASSLNAVRERPASPIFKAHFRTNFGLTALLAHATQGATVINSNTISTSLREDYLFSPANFVFGIAGIDHIGAQGLYLRQTYGGGYGRTLINNSRASFSAIAGVTAIHEKFFTGAHDQTLAVLVGEKLALPINKRIHLDHNLNFYPNLTNTGQYRFDTSTTLTANLGKRFNLNTGIIDLFLSNPPAGSHQNNVAFTTGIGYTF
jgi:putative salt-induced outer membrane protein YdiY